MQHFIIFLLVVFFSLVLSFFNRNQDSFSGKQILRVYGYSAFVSKFGPGPSLKKEFEKNCECLVEFVESADSGLLLQRVKLESQTIGSDLVIGLDQNELQKALIELKWRKIDSSQIQVDDFLKSTLENQYFIPYDWGVLAFVARKEDPLPRPKSLKDITNSKYKRKIALIDPRTSSSGLQFLTWVFQEIGKNDAGAYLTELTKVAHSFSSSWSSAYGLFQKKQVSFVLSYITSPIYHQIEEKNFSIEAIKFDHPHPVQVEFVGIPSNCKHCNLAQEFINLIISDQGQKIVMEKNYMFPLRKSVSVGTSFENLTDGYTISDFKIPSASDTDNAMAQWSSLRRGETSDK